MRTKGILITVFFLLAISLPLLLQCIGVEPKRSDAENRKLEPKPSFTFENTALANGVANKAQALYLDYKQYKEKYDRYYQDNFVLKEQLFDLYNHMQLNIFSKSPIPKKVVLGTSDWLFIGDGYSSVILESKAVINFTDAELQAIRRNLLKRNNWLQERGIAYYIAIAPEKHTLLGQYLPIRQGDRPTKRAQFKALMTGSGIEIADLTEPLLPYGHAKLYHKTDSHWNDLGAFLACQALLSRINQKYSHVPALNLADFKACHELKYDGDLARMLNLAIAEDQMLLQNTAPVARLTASSIPDYQNATETRFKGHANKLKVLVFRDSFCSAMMNFLKESFGETVFIWSYEFDKELIEREKPDIVIQEVVERELDQLLIK